MSSLSVKPDKCAILQETVNQIRNIKQRENAVQSSDPVQQGEVSSSRPTILSNEVFGPLLLEALEGFLFVVNGEGKVEQVTENVVNYIKFTKEDILGKSIYNFIHHGDHARFSASLLPMSIGWANESTNRSRSFSIRLLIKPPEDQDETVEEKQQRVSSYELMHILSAQLGDQVAVSDEEGSDSGPCLLCVASRISYKDKTITGIEQFTTKLDTSGKIIGVDTSGVSSVYSQYVNKDLMHTVLKDLVPPQDVHKLNAHLRETLSSGQSSSVFYRLQFGPDKFIQVQTKSKLFKASSHSSEADFVMATHSIVGEGDSLGPSDPGGGNGNNSVGGPLMTSVVNGTRNTAPVGVGSDSSTTSSTNTLLNSNATSYTPFNIDSDFNFDMFPSSTWELDSGWPEPRPDSRQSVTPVSTPTPRPPSNPAFSPVTSLAQSPLATFVAQPSPTIPNPSTPANPYNNNFPFSPLAEQNYASEEQKDTKANVLEEASSMMADSNKLRNLLTKPPNNPVVDSANDHDNRNKNRILKRLLKQQDEDDCRNDNRTSPRGLLSREPMPGPSELPKNSSISSGRNNMLLELLNDKSDDDDLEARGGVKKKNELLQQLLKPERTDENDDKKDLQSHDDTLLRSLGFTSSPSPPDRSRKRSSDGDESASKRTSDGKVTSTGSELCRRNQMLVSLLAKQTPNHQPIPPIPASILHATPQEKLPKIVDPNLTKNINNRNVNQQTLQQQQQQLQQQQNMLNNRLTRIPSRPQTNYLNAILSPQNNMQQRTENRLSQVISSGCYISPPTSNPDNNNTWAENNNLQSSNDPLLSDILDQVMDFVPDDLMHLLDSVDSQPNSYQTGEMSEKMAINIIQKSLMQVENVMKSPTSPNIAISGTPPSYSSATISNQNSPGRVFPPPPNYPQQNYKIGQRVVRANSNYPIAGTNITNPQQLLMHQQRKALAQQQEKRRLLQQQQQQQLLIPPNATAAEMSSGIQNIDSLLNNTVAPNVSLQRSASVPEPQSSPNYNQINQASRANSQQPYSPHSQLTSPIQQNFPQTTVGNYQQNTARLSPQSAFTQQLSPRQTYPQGNAANQNWTQQGRLTVQNPMLNAQLTRAPQQQRSISSPGTRHSPFAADSFPPPTSPNSAFNQNQYLRVQRTNSTPTATTHLPGGLGSPRPYGRADHHPHPYSPIPPPPPPSHHPMMYQQDAQYCYDQTGLQLAYNGADRGRAPPHLHPVVGARTQSQVQSQNRPSSQQQLLTQQQQVADLEALGLNFETDFYGGSSTR
ncbi:hypothetical protein HHI36_005719 [Cryptolaemus montrouzieri]|uniref:PAS domain-containing protein n=1 Tax=Cryptolaemus montrouzieri TaxID=559131 RepID=A0ABD2NV65_9CUCU